MTKTDITMKYTGLRYRSSASWPTMALLTLVMIGFGIFAELRTDREDRAAGANTLVSQPQENLTRTTGTNGVMP
ncbi:MAG: hypothetical protein ACFHX7_21490 [Pseudomonadota bacterium]